MRDKLLLHDLPKGPSQRLKSRRPNYKGPSPSRGLIDDRHYVFLLFHIASMPNFFGLCLAR
jgi:hypothetical protein